MRQKRFMFLAASLMAAVVAGAVACGGETKTVEVIKEVTVEKIIREEVPVEVIKEVTVEKIVERPVERVVTQVVEKPVEVIKEVPVERIVTERVEVVKEVIKEVPVERVVIRTIEKTVPVEVEKIIDGRFGGHLKVVAEASIASLDSISTSGGVNQTIAGHIYDQLFNLGEGFVPLPQMVSAWTVSDDGKSYTMTLRDGMTFHDGAAVTSADAVASLNRLLNSPRGSLKQVTDRLTSVEVVDGMSFKWTFHTPYGLLVENLATMNLWPPVQPGRLASVTPGNEVLTDFTGSGPFKLVKWDPGASVRMERFEQYVPRAERADGHAGGKKAFVDILDWLEVADTGTRVVLLEAGQVDFVQTAPQDDFNRLKENRDLQIYPHPLGRTPLLIMNGHNPPFDDPLARRAVAAALDTEEIMAAYGPPELWRTCGVIWGCDTRYHTTAGLENYNQKDIELGKSLLAQSSYDGRVIDVMVPVDQSTIAPITQIAAPRLKAIGLNTNVIITDWATVAQRRNLDDGYHIMGTWGTSGQPLGPAGAFTNPGHYCKCDSDGQRALSDEFILATTPEEKFRIAEEKQILYYQEMPWYYLGEFFSYHVSSKRLRGYPGSMGEPAFWNVWIED